MAQQNPFDQFDAPAQGNPFNSIPLTGADPARQYAAPKAEVDLSAARLAAARAAQNLDQDRAMAPAEIRKINAEAAKLERDIAKPDQTAQERLDRQSRLNQLVAQINRVQGLYDISVGTTKGLGGLQDYLPTDDNARFDAAGAALSQQGLAAFRVPGTGTVSDRDAIMFDRANLPQASTRDAAIEEQLRGLRSRVDEEMRTLGQTVPQWVAGGQGSDYAGIPGAVNPAAGGGGNGGGPVPSAPMQQAFATGGYREEADPARAGVNAEVNRLLRSGASDDEVRSYIQGVAPQADINSVNAVLDFRRRNPDYRGAYDASQLGIRRVPLSGTAQALNAVGQSGVGAYFANAADAVTAGTLDNLTANPERTRAVLSGIQQASPLASLAGTVTGSALAAGVGELGLARAGLTAGRAALGADAGYGALYGAGSADNGDRLVGAGVGGGLGAAGGVLGRQIANVAGGAIGGIRNADVRALRAAGVPLTAGQAVGGSGRAGAIVKGIEDRLAGLPVVGDLVNARRLEGFQGFNRAAFDEALAPIGANTGGVVGEAGVDAARAARSRAYSDALDNVRVQADAPFVGDMQAAISAGRALPDPMRGNLDYTLPTRVGNSFSEGSPLRRLADVDGRSQFIYNSRNGEIPLSVMQTRGGGLEISIDEANSAGANRLGQRELAEAASYLRAEYPDAKFIYGTRITGANPGREAGIDLSRFPIAEPAPGILTGAGFQQSIRGLRRDAKAMEPLPYGYDFGQVTRQAEGALEGLLDRQAPGALPAYRAANTANRNVEVIRDAVTRSRNGTRAGEAGVFAPSQLADAAAANARRFSNSNGTTNQPFFDLARAGQNVLPSRVADSGTAGRAVVAAGLGGLGTGAGAGYIGGDTSTGAGAGLGLAAALALGGSRTGQRAITTALLDRPEVLRRIGNEVLARQRLGGMFGASAASATPLLTGY